MSRRWGLLLLLLATPALAAAAWDGSGLSLADLAPYRAALERPAEGPVAAVTFRDLWDRPDQYQGRRVRVEGRVVRRFRQGALGTFPPLAEVWAVSPSGDPFCLVFPAPHDAEGDGRDKTGAAPGATVRFEGTYLKRLRYEGGDGARLAPLIVGDRPPAVTGKAAAEGAPAPGRGPDRLGWAVGLVAAGFVALALARRHVGGPSRRPRVERALEPPPEFVDGA